MPKKKSPTQRKNKVGEAIFLAESPKFHQLKFLKNFFFFFLIKIILKFFIFNKNFFFHQLISSNVINLIFENLILIVGICRYDRSIFDSIQPYIVEIATAYLEVCKIAREFKREFFGLRDYYSLIKMIYWFCSKDNRFTWSKLEHAVKRNFSGLEIDCIEPFKTRLYNKLDNSKYESDPGCEPIDLLESALKSEYSESISRYLLFLTENSSAIDIIQSYLINSVKIPIQNLTVVFGSSFRSDQQYSEVCRNISLIKNSMEIGKTVILLNSYNLYESLYDALNQYYYEFAGQK